MTLVPQDVPIVLAVPLISVFNVTQIFIGVVLSVVTNIAGLVQEQHKILAHHVYQAPLIMRTTLVRILVLCLLLAQLKVAIRNAENPVSTQNTITVQTRRAFLIVPAH